MIPRQVKEGLLHQGEDEQIAYQITTTPWGSSPTSVAVVAKDVSANYADVSATVLSGTASATGDVITLPLLKSLTRDHIYRIEVKFTCSGNVFECYVLVLGER
jgi:hypothetical protein